jgi:hypothetical protein
MEVLNMDESSHVMYIFGKLTGQQKLSEEKLNQYFNGIDEIDEYCRNIVSNWYDMVDTTTEEQYSRYAERKIIEKFGITE